jgi:hypothetical protein
MILLPNPSHGFSMCLLSLINEDITVSYEKIFVVILGHVKQNAQKQPLMRGIFFSFTFSYCIQKN